MQHRFAKRLYKSIMAALNFSLSSRKPLRTFLVSARKVPKEADIGEALTGEAYRYIYFSNPFPRLRAALPYVPLPALVERMAQSKFLKSESGAKYAHRC